MRPPFPFVRFVAIKIPYAEKDRPLRRRTHTFPRKKRCYAAGGKRQTERREKYGESRKKIQVEKARVRRGLEENRKRDTGQGKQDGVEKRKRKKRIDERMRKRKKADTGKVQMRKKTGRGKNGRDKMSVGNGDKK